MRHVPTALASATTRRTTDRGHAAPRDRALFLAGETTEADAGRPSAPVAHLQPRDLGPVTINPRTPSVAFEGTPEAPAEWDLIGMVGNDRVLTIGRCRLPQRLGSSAPSKAEPVPPLPLSPRETRFATRRAAP